MNIDTKFFKSIYNNDTLFHYTKASTAIDLILYNKQLKFSPARNSNDPIESRRSERRTVYVDSEVGKFRSERHSQDVKELHAFVDDMERQFNQVCFCQNRMGSDFASEYYVSNFEGHEELFGFTKLRMWDQYADHFSGVCIAFSKEKVLSLNRSKFSIIEGEVKYVAFQELATRKIGNIQGNHLLNVGKEKYKRELEQLTKASFFFKHTDYAGESEYRIGTLFDKSKCSFETIRDEMHFDRTMMLDVSGCVKAIFVSSFAHERQKKDLLQYADDLKVEMIEMKWEHDSFNPRDYRSSINFIKRFSG